MDDSTNAHKPANTTPDESESSSSLLQGFRRWLKSLTGESPSLKEALEEAIEEHEEQSEEPMASEEKVILHNVLSFSDHHVGDIMVPRADIAAISCDLPSAALKTHIIEQHHTRIPVYKDSLDHVLGFVHIKDLLPMLAGDKPFNLKSVLHPLLFVPPSMRIIDLLIRMRRAGCHMAIVVDEYGGTDGLVTLENLFEEIVGDIQDEHDAEEGLIEKILRVGPNAFEADARISIEKLEQQLARVLVPEERRDEFDTLGGLIFAQLGRVPARGEVIPHDTGIRFEILEADPRRIRRVRILMPS